MVEVALDAQHIAETEKVAAVAIESREYKFNNKKRYLIVKRVFDVTASVAAGVVLMIPMLVTALLIKLESPGPVIYSQERLGKDGKPFMMYKFRSMYVDAEKNGPQWAKVNDHRCTKVGKVIRVFHIDELPQLWNVIKGEMSVVGPRPERAFFYEIFKEKIPDFHERLRVLPGLTCIAQVNGCYDLQPEERFAYDVEYMEKQSVWLDMKCILETFPVIFNHKGAR